MEGYLAHKWGATDSLDANHPYKNVAPIFDNKPLISLDSLQADAIKVDFGRNNTPPLQAGYVGFNPWGGSSADNGNLVEQTYSNPFGNSSSSSRCPFPDKHIGGITTRSQVVLT